MAPSPTRTRSRGNRAPAVENAEAASRRLAKEAARKRQINQGLLSLLGIVVIGIGLTAWFTHRAGVERAAAEALAAAQTALRTELDAFDLGDEQQALRAVSRLQATEAVWQGWPSSMEFHDRLLKTQSALDGLVADHALRDSVQQLEQQVKAGPKDLGAWTALHDRAAGLADAAHRAGTAVKNQFNATADSIDQGCFAALREASKAAGSDAATARRELVRAEDLAETRMESTRDPAAKKDWERRFQECAKDEDALVAATLDAAAIAKVEWQALLPGTGEKDWAGSASLGLQHRVEGAELSIDGPAAASDRAGITVLHGHEWRNCEFEFDAILVKGSATLLMRSGKKADPKAAAAVRLSTEQQPGTVTVPAATSVHFDVLVLGEKVEVSAGGQKTSAKIPLQARRGEFGILTQPGSELHLSHLRVRPLD